MAVEVKEQATGRDRVAIVRALKAFGTADFRDDPHSSLPLELAVLELVAEEPAPAPRVAPEPKPARSDPPAERVAAPAPRPEPSFSIPSADMDELASTAATASFEAPSEPPQEIGVPVPAAPASNGAEDLLERVRLACREVDKILAGLLNGSCEVLAVEDDAVVLGFYHTFHLERAESEPNAGKLTKLFGDALGRSVTIRFEKHAAPERSQSGGSGGHLVQAAKELGARPVGGTQSDEGGDNG
jgi:hypothetical protein